MRWKHNAHLGLPEAIRRFKHELPGWWFTLGECERSCDASCAPTRESEDIVLASLDDRFNSGFHADLPHPYDLSDALLDVMEQALEAKKAYE